MTGDVPPWARPRESPAEPVVIRRVRPEKRTEEDVVRGPAAGPPPGRRPPVATPPEPGAEPGDVRRDPYVGLITSPVTVTPASGGDRTSPGVVAVAMSAVIALFAVAATALAGRAGAVVLGLGAGAPILCVATVAVARRLAARGGLTSECRFTVRSEAGRSDTYVLRGAARTALLRTGDLVRIRPGRPGLAWLVEVPDRRVEVLARRVEVLAGPDGPVVRRFTARSAATAGQWLGLVLSAALLVLTLSILIGAF
ncbi:hypothetical protein [Actinoplanes sp. NPDC049265]|uniref:hypothetical protein n=1 Tax=Actinoplanes sp. NPDC049265 TaxID=3363902 RepID=UPI0037215E5F